MITETVVAPRTTTRAVLDPTRLCNLRCDFCYYLPSNSFHSVKPWEQQAAEVIAAKSRGCDSADLTGGDPLDNPHIVELVKLCCEQGISLRIISSLICSEDKLTSVLDAGVDDWLVSMHGAKAETHNAIVHNPEKGPVERSKYRQIQLKRLAKIMDRMDWCTNYVMIEKNQTEMSEWAQWLVSLPRPPKIANFINFNSFPDWLTTPAMRAKAVANVVDLRIAGPILDEAIDILEDNGIGVNVRYMPMCGVAERHRKNICNDLHVAFDFGEWDNAFGATTLVDQVYETYSVPLSKRNEEKGQPCSGCDHQWICGGANQLWHKLALEKFGTETLTQISLPDDVHWKDFWHYRGMNARGLYPRVT